MDKVLVVIPFALLFVVFSAMRWKEASYALIYVVIFEGVFRKWVLPSFSNEIYLVKDLVLVGALIGWWLDSSQRSTDAQKRFFAAVGVFALFGAIQVLNPAMGSLVVGVFGLKAYVLWAGFPILLHATVPSPEKFQNYIVRVLLVGFPVCLLALVQAKSPSASMINIYAGDSSEIHTFGEDANVRVTGTFSFFSGLCQFLIFSFCLLLPVILHSKYKYRLLISNIIMPLIVATSVMTGSRWPIFFLGIFSIGYLGTIITLGIRRVASFAILIGPVLMTLLAISFLFQSTLTNWVERTQGAADDGDTFYSRTIGEMVSAFVDPEIVSITGDGIGSTNNAAISVSRLVGLPVSATNRPVESEPTRVMAEMGVIGFVLWYALKCFLIYRLFQVALDLRDDFLKSLGIAGMMFLAVGIMAPVAFDSTMGAFFWFIGGLCFILPDLDKKCGNPQSAMLRRKQLKPQETTQGRMGADLHPNQVSS